MGISGKAGPSRAWFILPSLLLLAGLVLGGIAIASFVNFMRADFHDYQPSSSISATKDGFTLYVEDGVLGQNPFRMVMFAHRPLVQGRFRLRKPQRSRNPDEFTRSMTWARFNPGT